MRRRQRMDTAQGKSVAVPRQEPSSGLTEKASARGEAAARKKVPATFSGAGYTTTYAYDSLNRQTAVTSPVGGVTTTVYGAVGNVTASIP